MLYEVDYHREDPATGEDTSYQRVIEGPAHRRGRLPARLVADLALLGYQDGAHRFTVSTFRPARMGYTAANGYGWSSMRVEIAGYHCDQAAVTELRARVRPPRRRAS